MDNLIINTSSFAQPLSVPPEEAKVFDVIYAVFQDKVPLFPTKAEQALAPLDRVKLNKIYSAFPELLRPLEQCDSVDHANRMFDIQNKLALSLNESFMPVFSKIAYAALQTLNPAILEYLQKRYIPNVNDEEILKIYFLLENLNFVPTEILETPIGERFIKIYSDQIDKLNALTTLNPAVCTLLVAVAEVDIRNQAKAHLFKAYFNNHLSHKAQDVLWNLLCYHLQNQKSVFDLIQNVSKIGCFIENFIALNLDKSIADEAYQEIASAHLIGNLPNMNGLLSDFASLKFDGETLTKILREISSILTPERHENSIIEIVSSFKYIRRLPLKEQIFVLKKYTNTLVAIQSNHPQEEALAIIRNLSYLLEKFQSLGQLLSLFHPPLNQLKVLVDFAEEMLHLNGSPASAQKIVDFLSNFFIFASDLYKRTVVIAIYVHQLSFEKVIQILNQTLCRDILPFAIKSEHHPDQIFVGSLLKEFDSYTLSKFAFFPLSFWKEMKENKLYADIEISSGAIERFFSEMPEKDLSVKVFADLKQVAQLIQRNNSDPEFQQIITNIPPDIRAKYLDFFIQKFQEPMLKSFSHNKRMACFRLLYSVPEELHEKIIRWISTQNDSTVLNLRHADYQKAYPYDLANSYHNNNWTAAVNRNAEKMFYSTFSTNYKVGVGDKDFDKAVELRNHLTQCANEIASLHAPLNPLNPYLIHRRITLALDTEELCPASAISHITLLEGGYKYSWNLEKIRQLALQPYAWNRFLQITKDSTTEEFRNYKAQEIFQHGVARTFCNRTFQEGCGLLNPLDSKSKESLRLFLENRFHKQIGYPSSTGLKFDPYTQMLPEEALKLDPKQLVIVLYENLAKHIATHKYVLKGHESLAKQLFGFMAERDKNRVEDYLSEDKTTGSTDLTRFGVFELLAEAGYFNKEKNS